MEELENLLKSVEEHTNELITCAKDPRGLLATQIHEALINEVETAYRIVLQVRDTQRLPFDESLAQKVADIITAWRRELFKIKL